MEADSFRLKRTSLVIIHCFIPLFFGGLIYIAFRTTELRMFNWFYFLGLENLVDMIRANLYLLKNHLPNWIYFSLPDGLWVYSFTSILLIYWNNNLSKVKYWLLTPFITGVLVEILQGLQQFPGTFDVLDLTLSVLGFLLSIIIINYKFKQYDKKNQLS